VAIATAAVGDDAEAGLLAEQVADRRGPRRCLVAGPPHLDDRDLEVADVIEQIDGTAPVGKLLELPARLEQALDPQPHDRMRVDDHAAAVSSQRFLQAPSGG